MKTKKYTRDQSSSVAEISYNPEDQSLEVEFHSGKRYKYPDFPEDLFEAAKEAPSIGSFVSSVIVRSFAWIPMDKRETQGVDL
jgi:hypothetical protein